MAHKESSPRDDDERPSSEIEAPETATEILKSMFDRRIRPHLSWDPAKLVLVVTALVALGGMTWAVWGPRSGQRVESAEIAVESVTMPTALDLGLDESASSTGDDTTTTEPGPVTVDVSGAVKRPGVVALPANARVLDAIEAVGGHLGDADLTRVNRAAPIQDGQRIYIPRRGEDEPPEVLDPHQAMAASSPHDGSGEAPVNLNTADAQELEKLPGVGPATAEAIIEHRTTSGRFRSVDDLLDVSGIGEGKLAKLRDRATV